MKLFARAFVAMVFFVFATTTAHAATTPNLGWADIYGVLSSTFTNTTVTTVSGSVGFTTGPSVAPLGTHAFYGSGAPYATAGVDQGAALADLDAEVCDFNFGAPTDLSLEVQPLVPGVYCVTGATTVGVGGITLDGAGTYIFRSTGALDTVANAVVTLQGGADTCDVFWTPGAATTLGADTTFEGTVIDDSGITVGANTVWTGRALAFGETVTTDTASITVPSCGGGPALATLHVIKIVTNDDGDGNAEAEDFTLYVKEAGSNVAGSPASGADAPGTLYSLPAGTFVVSEDANADYTSSFSGDCDSSGTVDLISGDDKTCTITNNDVDTPNSSSGSSRHRSSSPNRSSSPTATSSPKASVVATTTPVVIPTLPNTGFPPATTSGRDAILLASVSVMSLIVLATIVRKTHAR